MSRKCDAFRVIIFYMEREHAVVHGRIYVMLIHWCYSTSWILFFSYLLFILYYHFSVLKRKEKSILLTF